MKIIDEIWDSIRGNIRVRVADPIIGVFILSWSVFNWDKLAILFFGSGEFEARVNKLSGEMSFTVDPNLILQNLELWLFPILFSFFYIFLWPVISGWVADKTNPTELKRHQQLIKSDITKSEQQVELNKVHLRADPKNKFLEQEVEIDLAIKKSNAEKIEQECITSKDRAEEARASKEREIQERNNAASIAEEARVKEYTAKLELQKKERIENNEKLKLKVSVAENKSTMASHRFPSIYLFMHDISESLRRDEVVMSLESLSSCVAIIFGYDDFESLLEDKNFTNRNLKKLKFVILDSDYSVEKLLEILENEQLDIFDSEWLIEHIQSVFNKLPYELMFEDSLAEMIFDRVTEGSFDLLEIEAINSVMAETDTSFDEVSVERSDTYGIDPVDGAFFVRLVGNASGTHRKDPGVIGQKINFELNVKFPVILGKFGFSDYEIGVIDASVEY